MAVALDTTERYLIDDTTGAVVGVKHSAALIARVVEGALGNVFQSGLGTGELRQALKAVEGIDPVWIPLVQEENADVVALYEATYPADSGAAMEAPIAAVLDDQIASGSTYGPYYDWTTGVFDWTVTDLSQDAATIADLKTLWPALGGRIMVLSSRSDLTLDGWSALPPEFIDGTYLYVFDRFEPSGAIGEDDPHGTVYIPGYGWQP